jgi:hypothetical protein
MLPPPWKLQNSHKARYHAMKTYPMLSEVCQIRVQFLHETVLSSFFFLGSTAQLRPWPPPQNPAEFLGGFSTFSLLQGRVVSPTPNPYPGGPGLYLYPPEAGWLPILVASYDTHGLRRDYSYSPVTTRGTKLFVTIPDLSTFWVGCAYFKAEYHV